MAKKPDTSKAEKWVADLANLCRSMPRGPQNDTAVIRLIAQHSTDPGEVMVFLTSMAERPK